ncbi:MAG: M48 family metalloprotease [Allosphingosinicella sp.]
MIGIRRPGPRSVALLAAAGLAFAPVVEAGAECLPGMCGFTENGKKGPFVQFRVDPADLAKADGAIAGGSSSEGLLAAQSVNRGQLYGTGLSMRQTEAKLSEMLNRIAGGWKHRPTGALRVRIVGSPSFVPQSFADNVIVVPFGVLNRAQTDEQVAWLLAHEYSHLALGHFAREARAKKRSRNIGQAVGAIDTLLLLAQHRVDNRGGDIRIYQVNDKGMNALGDTIWARSRQLEGALSLFGGFFSRADEDKADVAGLDLAVAAGYSHNGALNALNIIETDQRANATLLDQIGKDLGGYAKRSGSAAVGSIGQSTDLGALATGWFKDLAENALVIGFGKLKKAYSAQHRPPDKRAEGIRKYYKNAYDDAPGHPPTRAWLTQVRGTPEFREAATAVDAHTRALVSIGADNPVQAQLDLQPALTTRYATTPYILNLQARIFEKQGNLRGAESAYSKAARFSEAPVRPVRTPVRRGKGKRPAPKPAAPPPPPFVSKDPYLEQNLQGFVDHVSLLVRMNNHGKALATIGEAKRRFGDDQAFLPSYIAIYFETRQPEMLIAALNRCTEVADPGLEERCRASMMTDTQQKKYSELSPADQAKVRAVLARTSAKARSGGLLNRIGDALNPSEE